MDREARVWHASCADPALPAAALSSRSRFMPPASDSLRAPVASAPPPGAVSAALGLRRRAVSQADAAPWPGADAPDEALAARILVAVPVLDEADALEACLASLMTPDTEGVRFVLADGGSTDGTRALAEALTERHPNLSVIDNPRRNQAAGVNAVVRAASGDAARDILVRCDAHAAYPPGFVLGVARCLLAKGADNVAVPMDAVPREGAGCFERANAWAVDTLMGSGGSAHRGGQRSMWVEHGHHAAFLLRRFRALGGYDDRMVPNEDAEYDTRLTRAGGRVWIEAAWRMRYHPRRTVAALWRQYEGYGRGRAAHMALHRTRPRLRQFLPAALVLMLTASLMAAPFEPAALALPAGYLAALAVYTLWMMATRRSLCAGLTGLACAVMHLAWGTGFWRQFPHARLSR